MSKLDLETELNKLKSLKVAQVQGCVGDGVCVMLCDDAVCDVVCDVVCNVVCDVAHDGVSFM